ncbi:hypothetical protein M0804_000006 [Polistes exclamans]|nr:hypothetical protein M0804_000006 [Polistes exclamans]
MNNEVSRTLAGRPDLPQPRQTPRLALSYGVKITSNCISLDLPTEPFLYSPEGKEESVGGGEDPRLVLVVTPEEISRPTVLFEVALSKLAEPQRIALNYAQKLRGSRGYYSITFWGSVSFAMIVSYNRLIDIGWGVFTLMMQVIDFKARVCQSIVYPAKFRIAWYKEVHE